MPLITRVSGALLILTGLIGYIVTGTSSLTALIPAIFGLILVLLGVWANTEETRKHAMHAAAAVGLISLIVALGSLVLPSLSPRSLASVLAQVAMIIIATAFLGLCVRSFINTRRTNSR
jgi:hypothetical protein